MKHIAHEAVSATELARNMSMNIDRVRMSGRSLYVTRGVQTIAELCPPPKRGVSVEHLVNLLQSLPSLDNDADSMAEDLKSLRQRSTLPENPWES